MCSGDNNVRDRIGGVVGGINRNAVLLEVGQLTIESKCVDGAQFDPVEGCCNEADVLLALLHMEDNMANGHCDS